MPLLKHLVFAIMTLSCASSMGGVVVQNFDSLSHGQIVHNDQFYDGGSDTGFRVVGDNSSDDRDLIVAFDTNRTPTEDPDLEAPFDSGNLVNADGDNVDFNGNSIDFSEVLIIQEHGVGDVGTGPNLGFLDDINDADDEGDRPAGSITFEFNQAISSFGIDLLDIEETGEVFSFVFSSNGDVVAEVDFNDFLEASNSVLSQTGQQEVVFGNNSANRIVPITAENLSNFTETTIASFDQVTVNLGGSGALDNIRYSQAVPEPTSLAVWLGAMFAFVGCVNRRRSTTN